MIRILDYIICLFVGEGVESAVIHMFHSLGTMREDGAQEVMCATAVGNELYTESVLQEGGREGGRERECVCVCVWCILQCTQRGI